MLLFANYSSICEYYPGLLLLVILAKYLDPGCSSTRVLNGYPAVKRVPGYLPKIPVNSGEYPGASPLKLVGTRLRQAFVG